MPPYKAGDLVWVHIGGGYGWWPCQVMEPHHVAEDRRADVLRLKRTGWVLVHCHGDKTFNWYEPRDVEPISKNCVAREGQKHKSPGVKKFFKLALEEVQEIQATRAGKKPATKHEPVDFTRPETYEMWLQQDGTSDEPDEVQWRFTEPTTADAEQCTGAALLEWLKAAAVTPHDVCQELAAAAPANAAAMHVLWSFYHHNAVAHGAAYIAMLIGSKPSKQSKKSIKPAAAARDGSVLHKQQAGAKKRKAAAAGDKDAAAGDNDAKKVRHISNHEGPSAAVEVAQAAEAGASELQPKRKRGRPRKQKPTADADEVLAPIIPPVAWDDPQLNDRYLISYGGPIEGTKLAAAVQLLRRYAVSPEEAGKLTVARVKAIAVILRYREAAYARSGCKMNGEVGLITCAALERAGAMPIRPWPLGTEDAEGSPLWDRAQVGKSAGKPEDLHQKQDAAATRTSGSGGRQAAKAAQVKSAAADAPKRRKRKGERPEYADNEKELLGGWNDMVCQRPHDDVDSDNSSSSSSGDSSDSEAEAAGKQRHRGSVRAAAAAAGKAAKLADFRAAKDASSRQQRQQAQQQHLQHVGVRTEQDSAQEHHSDSDDSEVEPSPARAASSAAATKPVSANFKDYQNKIGTRKEFESSLQRWLGERGKSGWKMGKVAKQNLTMDDLYEIFKLVAAKGGYAAADASMTWTVIGKTWSLEAAETNKNIGQSIKAVYKSALLEYEAHVSHGCPVSVKKVLKQGTGHAAAADKTAADKPSPKPSPAKQQLEGQQSVDIGKPVKLEEDEDGMTPLEVALAREAAAAAADKQKQGGGSSSAAAINPNLRRVVLKFRKEFRLPPLLTVLRAANRYEPAVTVEHVKVQSNKGEVHIECSSAALAATAAAGLKGQWVRKILRLPDTEPPLDVEVTEIKPLRPNLHQQHSARPRHGGNERDERLYNSSGGLHRNAENKLQHHRQRPHHGRERDRGDRQDYKAGSYRGVADRDRDRGGYDSRGTAGATYAPPPPHEESYAASAAAVAGPGVGASGQHYLPLQGGHPPGLPRAQARLQLPVVSSAGPAVYHQAGPPPPPPPPPQIILPPGTHLPGGIVVLPATAGAAPGLLGALSAGGPAGARPGVGPLVMAPAGAHLTAVVATDPRHGAPVDPRRQRMEVAQQQQQQPIVLMQQPGVPPQPPQAPPMPIDPAALQQLANFMQQQQLQQQLQHQQQHQQPPPPQPQQLQQPQQQPQQSQQQQPAFSARLDQLLSQLGQQNRNG